MNKFEIIIPAYNCQNYLDKCLNSIEIQDYPLDLVNVTIIDDNSNKPLEIKKHSFTFELIRNNQRMYAGYNRFIKYSKCKDNDIVVFLDGDDWFTDTKCLKVINKIYSNNNISWSISNHKIFKNNKTKIIPTFINIPLEPLKPKIAHLRCGYGYVWNKMTDDDLKVNGEYIKWMTDWNENLFAIKNYGQPYKISSSLAVYNLDTSKTKKENDNYQEMLNWFKNKYQL